MNITKEVKEKNPFYIYNGKIKKIFCYKEEKTNEKIKYQFKKKKRQHYFEK